MKAFGLLTLSIICSVVYISAGGSPIAYEQTYDWVQLNWLNNKIAMMRTEDGSIYRTTDTGLTWTSINELLPQSETTGNAPAFIYTNNLNSSKVYIRGSGDVCWTSNDYGDTWRAVNPGQILINLDWHPVQPDWIIASDTTYGVWASQNFGSTWTNVADAAYTYTWGDAGTGEVPNTRIYLTVADESNYQFAYTEDWGVTTVTVQSRGIDFLFRDKQIFAATHASSDGDQIGLKVSEDVGKKIKVFRDAVFPEGTDVEYKGYSILDDRTGAVFLGVDHQGSGSDWGDLYVSDASGSRYAVSLRKVHQEFGYFDFARIHGLEGIYITNKLKNPDDQYSGVQSVLTYDNGATWHGMKYPQTDSNNATIHCSNNPCNLHLHSESSTIPYEGSVYIQPPLSTSKAIGLIVANGNVGNELSYSVNEINTFMSRDGGVHWIELRKGPSHFALLDHGSVIVLIPAAQATDTLYYSLDYGTTPVKSFTFANQPTPLTVERIITENDAIEEKMIVLGTRSNGEKSVIGIDFTNVFDYQCDLNNDYENWEYSNEQESCLLGHDIVYKRRIATRNCYNDENVDHISSMKNCSCTEDDWECDVDFERGSDGTCVYSLGTYAPEYPPEFCPSGTQYYKSKGYRKEAGNTCEGGVDHSGEGPFDCPNLSKEAKRGWIAAAVLIPLILIIFVVAAFALRSEAVREKLPFLKFLATWKVGYSGFGKSGGTSVSTSLIDSDEENEREDFSIQAEEIEDTHLEELAKPEKGKKQDSLISMDEPAEHSDDFNPRR